MTWPLAFNPLTCGCGVGGGWGAWESRAGAESQSLGGGGGRPACGETARKRQHQRKENHYHLLHEIILQILIKGRIWVKLLSQLLCYLCSLWTMWATRESEMPGKASSAIRMASLSSSRTMGFPFTCSCLALSWKWGGRKVRLLRDEGSISGTKNSSTKRANHESDGGKLNGRPNCSLPQLTRERLLWPGSVNKASLECLLSVEREERDIRTTGVERN